MIMFDLHVADNGTLFHTAVNNIDTGFTTQIDTNIRPGTRNLFKNQAR